MPCHYKTDIARAYYPHLQPRQALRQLKRKINGTPPLAAAMRAVGYRQGDRSATFSAREVRILKKYLGDCAPDG